jgi:hypothetical protein
MEAFPERVIGLNTKGAMLAKGARDFCAGVGLDLILFTEELRDAGISHAHPLAA